MNKDNITGLILAGGKARRMGGIDKGLVPLKGEPMIKHVIKRLNPQVSEILINANREIETYQHQYLRLRCLEFLWQLLPS